MRELQGLMARLLDVAAVIVGAAVASRIRFDAVSQRGFYAAFVLFSAAFALALFPAFDIYASWRGRSKRLLAGQVSLAWLAVQGCALISMYSLTHIDVVSRLWFAYWTAIAGGLLIAWRLIAHAVLARARRAGLNLHQVAIAGSAAQCMQIVRRIEAEPGTGFRATALFNPAPDAAVQRAGPALAVCDTLDAFAD